MNANSWASFEASASLWLRDVAQGAHPSIRAACAILVNNIKNAVSLMEGWIEKGEGNQ